MGWLCRTHCIIGFPSQTASSFHLSCNHIQIQSLAGRKPEWKSGPAWSSRCYAGFLYVLLLLKKKKFYKITGVNRGRRRWRSAPPFQTRSVENGIRPQPKSPQPVLHRPLLLHQTSVTSLHFTCFLQSLLPNIVLNVIVHLHWIYFCCFPVTPVSISLLILILIILIGLAVWWFIIKQHSCEIPCELISCSVPLQCCFA